MYTPSLMDLQSNILHVTRILLRGASVVSVATFTQDKPVRRGGVSRPTLLASHV